MKQTLLFKVLKLLKVEIFFRFNSPFIIFGTKTWKIFALKLGTVKTDFRRKLWICYEFWLKKARERD